MKGIIGVGFKRKFLGLCVPPLLLALADGSLTVLGQSEIYWSNFLAVNESSPAFGALLKSSPWMLAAGAVVWMVAFSFLIIAAPPTPALILSFAITLGHTVGSGSWLFEHFKFGAGYQIANAYYLMSACLIGFGFRHAFPAGVMKSDDALNIPEKTRLLIAGIIFAAATACFLLPLQR
jgi:hypothetical protein